MNRRARTKAGKQRQDKTAPGERTVQRTKTKIRLFQPVWIVQPRLRGKNSGEATWGLSVQRTKTDDDFIKNDMSESNQCVTTKAGNPSVRMCGRVLSKGYGHGGPGVCLGDG